MMTVGQLSALANVSVDVSLNFADFSLSSGTIVEGQPVRVYASAKSNASIDTYGWITFYADGQTMGPAQPISIVRGNSDSVFIDWTPSYGGYVDISAVVTLDGIQDSDPSNNSVYKNDIFVDFDTDGDNFGNQNDIDDDNDGLTDEEEAQAGTDHLDHDTDDDGLNDSKDPAPLDGNSPNPISTNNNNTSTGTDSTGSTSISNNNPPSAQSPGSTATTVAETTEPTGSTPDNVTPSTETTTDLTTATSSSSTQNNVALEEIPAFFDQLEPTVLGFQKNAEKSIIARTYGTVIPYFLFLLLGYLAYHYRKGLLCCLVGETKSVQQLIQSVKKWINNK